MLLEPRQFGVTTVEAARPRGGAEPARFSVAGRHRIELQAGMWQTAQNNDTVNIGSGSLDQVIGLNYTHYVSEDLGITVGVQTAGVAMGISSGASGSFTGTASLLAVPVGVRWNPLRARARGPFRPLLAAKIGPAFGFSQGIFNGDTTLVGSYSQATLFTHAGIGFDYFPARSFAIGVNGGYDWMASFARPVGSQRNLSGPEVNFNFGWLFGHGHVPSP